MRMRTTSFVVPDSLYRVVNIAAADVGQCASEYIRDALAEKLARHAEANPLIRTVVDGAMEPAALQASAH